MLKKSGVMQGRRGIFPIEILYEQSESTRLKIIFLCDYFCIWHCALNLKVVYPMTLRVALA